MYDRQLSALEKFFTGSPEQKSDVLVTSCEERNRDMLMPIPYYFNVSYFDKSLQIRKNDLYRISEDGTIEEIGISGYQKEGWQPATHQTVDEIVKAAQQTKLPEVVEEKTLEVTLDQRPKVLLFDDSTIDNKGWIGRGGILLNRFKEWLGIRRDSLADRIRQARRRFFKTELSVAEHLQEQLEPLQGQSKSYEIKDYSNDGFLTKHVRKGGHRNLVFPGGILPLSFPNEMFKPLHAASQDVKEADCIVLSIGGNNFRDFLFNALYDKYNEWRKKTPAETKDHIENEYDKILKELHDEYVDIVETLRGRYPKAKIVLMTQYYPSASSTINYIYPFMSKVGQILGKGNNPNNPMDVIHEIMKETYIKLLKEPVIKNDPNLVVADVTSSLDPFDKNNHVMQIEPSGEGGKKMAKMLAHVIRNSNETGKVYQFLPDFFDGRTDENIITSNLDNWEPKHPYEFTGKACYNVKLALATLDSESSLERAISQEERKEIQTNEQLKNSIIMLQQVSEYLRLDEKSSLTTRKNFRKILADTNLQSTLSNAHNYWNSGRFGWLRTHGDTGKQETARFVKKLIEQNIFTKKIVKEEMRTWVKSSNLHNSSRLFYALKSSVFNKGTDHQKTKDKEYLMATQAQRQAMKQMLLGG